MRPILAAALFSSMVVLHVSPAPAADRPAGVPGLTLKVADVVDRMNKAESGVIVRMRMYHPLTEVYIQNVVPDEQFGWVPAKDEYFLGQFELRETPKLQPIDRTPKASGTLARLLPGARDVRYLPDGFAAMAAPDWKTLDRSRYEFTFIRREFLGEARCLVFDVRPLGGEKAGFAGRIWIEDRDYNVVRYNGINRATDQTLSSFFRRKLSFHVDGWRVNVMPGVWLPAYVYCEETDLRDAGPTVTAARFKSQIRLWGYEAQAAEDAQQLTTIHIDEPSAVDAAGQAAQWSPVLSQRRWEQEAETNVVERLEKIGLLSPAGEVDRVLDTVLNNLVLTNHLTLERPLHCRVLLTTPLESFTVGHTIVLSRGLIDVLPDEASLATMLAHELGHVVLGHPLIDTKFAFADRLMVGDDRLLDTLQFHHSTREEAAADEKVIELLEHSPYQGKLADTGLFLRVVAQRSTVLPRLIQPHIGDHVADGRQSLRLAGLVEHAPELAPERLDQIPALPLGARLVVDPWSGGLSLDRSPAVALFSVREKVPLAVTALMPFLKYVDTPRTPLASR